MDQTKIHPGPGLLKMMPPMLALSQEGGGGWLHTAVTQVQNHPNAQYAAQIKDQLHYMASGILIINAFSVWEDNWKDWKIASHSTKQPPGNWKIRSSR